MNKQKFLTILLVISLALMFSLEFIFLDSLSNPVQGAIGYLIPVLAIITLILVPFAWRSPILLPLIIWSALLVVYRIVVMGESNISGQLYFSLTLVELGVLYLTLLITRQLALNLSIFEEGVKILTLVGDLRSAPTIDTANEAIRKEMRRSRFHQRPVSVIILEPTNMSVGAGANELIQEIQSTYLADYDKARLVQVIDRQVRSIDILMQGRNNDSLILLCPEMNTEHSKELGYRIRQSVENEMGVQLRYATSSFPDEGFTFDALLHRATDQLKGKENLTGQEPASIVEPGNS